MGKDEKGRDGKMEREKKKENQSKGKETER